MSKYISRTGIGSNFQLNKYLYKFAFLSPRHKLELFDKLILPIFIYGGEVWVLLQANAIERVHLQFCKRLLGAMKTMQNDFIYGKLGRTSCLTKRYILIIKYWFKISLSEDVRYIKLVYIMVLEELNPNKTTKIENKHTFSERLHCPYIPSCIICRLYSHRFYSLLEFE